MVDHAALLAIEPKTWVDRVILTVLKDPQFYAVTGLVAFLVLVLTALWATRIVLKQIDHDERAKTKKHD